MNTRFARFINVPELMTIFGEVADIRTAEMLNLPIPKLKGDKARTIACPASSVCLRSSSKPCSRGRRQFAMGKSNQAKTICWQSRQTVARPRSI